MKLIDLLIENSKGNHPDFRFKHTKHMIWKWDGCWYLCGASELDATFRVLGQLNEEVEIIEDKKMEKMEFCYKVADEMQNANNERFKDFINEIIDKVNGDK